MKKKVWLLSMLAVLCVMAVVVSPKKVLAAGKTYYYVNAQNISQFKKSGSKLVVKTDKNTIWKAAKHPFATAPYDTGKIVKNKKSLSLKPGKKCKWSWRVMGSNDSIKYKELKKRISDERKAYLAYKKGGGGEEYETYFTLILTVEKGKITEVTAW